MMEQLTQFAPLINVCGDLFYDQTTTEKAKNERKF
jgi:hypothetical protein